MKLSVPLFCLIFAVPVLTYSWNNPQANRRVSTNKAKKAPRPQMRVGADGLPENNDIGLIPVHDLHAASPSTQLTGYFYLGGDWRTNAEWEYEQPKILVAPDDGSGFNPAAAWTDINATCTPSTGAPIPGQGSKVTFNAAVPTGMNLTKFWLAVELRGDSLEGLDEISFAASEYPNNHTKLLYQRPVKRFGRTIYTNNLVPITLMYPYRGAGAPISHWVYTNQGKTKADLPTYILTTKPGTAPDLGLPWQSTKALKLNPKTEDSNSTGPRKHAIRFDKPGGKTVFHYMVIGSDVSTVPSEPDVYEWSGVIRPPK